MRFRVRVRVRVRVTVRVRVRLRVGIGVGVRVRVGVVGVEEAYLEVAALDALASGGHRAEDGLRA